MKICPECKRTFDDELSFCLEDGTRLVSQSSGATTLIYPADPTVPTVPRPQPSPPPTPEPAPVSKSGSNKSIVAVILGVLGTLVIILIWAGIKIGIWYLDHNSNQNSGYTPPIVATASPSPSYDPIGLITSSPSPTPSPVESSSPSPDEAKAGVVTPGTYEWEGTRAIDKQHKASLRMRVAIESNGTYHEEVFLTFPDKRIDNLLGMEEKGRFTQSGEALLLSERQAREFNIVTGEWEPWGTPDDGSSSREKIRNVTQNSFDLYDDSENNWYTFVKVINLGNRN